MTDPWPSSLPQSWLPRGAGGVSSDVRRRSRAIVRDIRTGGEPALRRWAEQLDELGPGEDLVVGPEALGRALESLAPEPRKRLERVAGRIRDFALAQKACLQDLDMPVEGGRAGHVTLPVAAAGCYAPGGRYPLPSSVLMTTVTARAAGVEEVWVAGPQPSRLTLAAAALARANGFLRVGGAQAIAALAYGVGGVPACPVVVGPGNSYVTAAKLELGGVAAIDLPAGPSELLVVCDEHANPRWLAADLLAQAEHDPQARPMLISTDRGILARVSDELDRQLDVLPGRDIAERALANGGLAFCESLARARDWVDRIAPEHLQLALEEPREFAESCSQYGAVFLGEQSAEVFGDYGVGPNHVLPTGGMSRAFGGLSVMTFLRWRPWVEIVRPTTKLLQDTHWLADAERLVGHSRAAALRASGGRLDDRS